MWTWIARAVALASSLMVLQAADCSTLDQSSQSQGQTNTCPASDPLLCPNNRACCSAGNPYECSDANGSVQCYPGVPMARQCSGQIDYCSRSGSDQAPDTGYLQCAARAQTPLYCDSSSGPQLLQNVPGECCYIGAGATNQVGYLCVYGDHDSTGAVCGDMATIQDSCPASGTVVRCCYGAPC